jgi:transcriptional regulator with XRE-family HTH domain
MGKPNAAIWFGGRLRELREEAGLTRAALADLAGFSMRGIEQWERGEREPSWGNVLALAEALGVDCLAFTAPPADRQPPGRGRPLKAKGEREPAAKRPRGRPRKDDGDRLAQKKEQAKKAK